jgi:hypothetical protein
MREDEGGRGRTREDEGGRGRTREDEGGRGRTIEAEWAVLEEERRERIELFTYSILGGDA